MAAANPAPTMTRRQRRQARRQANRGNKPPATPTDPLHPKLNQQLGDFNPSQVNDWMTGVYNTVTDPTWLDVTNNPYLQQIAGQIDKNQNLQMFRDANSINASGGEGRLGSGVWQGMNEAAIKQAEEAKATGKAQLYGTALENQKNRLSSLYSALGNYNTGMLGVDVGYNNAAANMRGANASMVGANAAMKNANTGATQAAFERKMQTAAAQQDALNDYYNILAGIGGWGGETYGSQSGSYQPSMNPNTAAIMGGVGSFINSYYGNSGAGVGGAGGFSFGGGGNSGGYFNNGTPQTGFNGNPYGYSPYVPQPSNPTYDPSYQYSPNNYDGPGLGF